MTLNPLERYQQIRTTIGAMAESAETLIGCLVAEGKSEVAPEIVQMVAHTAVALTHQFIDRATSERGGDGEAGRAIDCTTDVDLTRRGADTAKGLPRKSSQMVGRRSGAIACQSGCDCCCYLNVPVSKPESQLIAYHLRRSLTDLERRTLAERIGKIAQRLETVNPSDRLSQKIPCVFLKNGQCLVYPVRPAACRDHHSIDLSACEESFGTGRWSAPGSDRHDLVANSATVAIAEACAAFGFDSSFGELHAELVAALESDVVPTFDSSDVWRTPEDLDNAILPTGVSNSPHPKPQHSQNFLSARSTSTEKPTPLSGQNMSQGLMQDLAGELITELSHKHNLAAEAIADWGSLDGPEESDDLSLFKHPLSAYFFDAHDSEVPSPSAFQQLSNDRERFEADGTPKGNRLQKSGRSLENDPEIDETELEDLIQEMVTEISQEENEENGKGEFWAP